jgi:hypothetical protein
VASAVLALTGTHRQQRPDVIDALVIGIVVRVSNTMCRLGAGTSPVPPAPWALQPLVPGC